MPITVTKNNINNTNVSFTQKIMNKYNSTFLPRILFSTAPSGTTEINNTSKNYNHNNEGDFDDLSTIKTSPDDEHLLKKKKYYVFSAGSIDGGERTDEQQNNSINNKKTTTVAHEEESAYDFDLITEQQKEYYCNYHNHRGHLSESHSTSENTNAEKIDSYIQKYQQNKHIMKQRIKQNKSITSSTNTMKNSASVLDSLAYSSSAVEEDESVDDTSTFDWSFKSSPWTVRCSTGMDSSGCERDAEEKEKTIQGDDEESCRSESQTSITKDEKKQNYHNSGDDDDEEEEEMQEIDLEDGSNHNTQSEIDNNNDTDAESNKEKERKACCSEMKLLYSYTSPFLFIVFALLLLGTVMYATSQIIIMDSSSQEHSFVTPPTTTQRNNTSNILNGHNNNQSLVFHVVEKTEMVDIDLMMNMNVTSSPTISPSDGHE